MVNELNKEDLIAEYNQPFAGWDFSYLAGRREIIRPISTWDYKSAVVAAMSKAQSMLDMGTGGGEYLASLQPLPPHTYATEGYAPNVPVARQRLEPLGIKVYKVRGDDHLPFEDNQFDLVINRHEAYSPGEVLRVVKPGGRFITQQVGGKANLTLHTLLGDDVQETHWDLGYAVKELEAAGWQIVEKREEFPITRYYDVGAIVWYLKAIPWEIPDFSVEKYFDKLQEIHELISSNGYVDVLFHQFFIVAQRG
jgi:SAM-dependent methyltransferase